MGKGSRRSKPLPKDWPTTTRRILRRDSGICHVCGHRGANGVDHIVAAIDGGSEDDTNLAAIHEHPCHAAKTSREANRHNPRAIPRKRKPESHPGRI